MHLHYCQKCKNKGTIHCFFPCIGQLDVMTNNAHPSCE